MARGFVLYHRTKRDTEGGNGQRLGFCKAKCHRMKRDAEWEDGQRLCLLQTMVHFATALKALYSRPHVSEQHLFCLLLARSVRRTSRTDNWASGTVVWTFWRSERDEWVKIATWTTTTPQDPHRVRL